MASSVSPNVDAWLTRYCVKDTPGYAPGSESRPSMYRLEVNSDESGRAAGRYNYFDLGPGGLDRFNALTLREKHELQRLLDADSVTLLRQKGAKLCLPDLTDAQKGAIGIKTFTGR